jgi:hypothetical protein
MSAAMSISGRLFRGAKGLAVLPAIALLLCASLLAALEVPSKPFLEKNSFLLSSAAFHVKLANDPAGLKAMRALPAHRFVIHKVGGDVRYPYAEPQLVSASSSAPGRPMTPTATFSASRCSRLMTCRRITRPRPARCCLAIPTTSIRSTPPTASRIICGRITEGRRIIWCTDSSLV